MEAGLESVWPVPVSNTGLEALRPPARAVAQRLPRALGENTDSPSAPQPSRALTRGEQARRKMEHLSCCFRARGKKTWGGLAHPSGQSWEAARTRVISVINGANTKPSLPATPASACPTPPVSTAFSPNYKSNICLLWKFGKMQ